MSAASEIIAVAGASIGLASILLAILTWLSLPRIDRHVEQVVEQTIVRTLAVTEERRAANVAAITLRLDGHQARIERIETRIDELL